MDSGQSPAQLSPAFHSSPRRELQLQGPRPSPLRVSKDSHKIKKPPFPPPASAPLAAPPLESREPIIIYTVSPKIIHVEPSNFMDLVQRLTGSTIADPITPPVEISAAPAILSPADMCRESSNPGILSPAPSSLPQISPAFFSPSSFDSTLRMNFLCDLSPAGFQVGRTSPGGGSFWNNSGNLFSPSAIVPSPGAAAWDLFNLQDF